jgi:hypothetical protein
MTLVTAWAGRIAVRRTEVSSNAYRDVHQPGDFFPQRHQILLICLYKCAQELSGTLAYECITFFASAQRIEQHLCCAGLAEKVNTCPLAKAISS